MKRTLEQIYSHPELAQILVFKGGTSLSKVYGLIERFSEDIDLILDWRLVSESLPPYKVSKTAQTRLNKSINSRAVLYIKNELLVRLQEALAPFCVVKIESGVEAAGHVLEVIYPTSEKPIYLRPSIRLEIGPLAAWLPHERGLVKSYAAEEFPHLFKKSQAEVKVTSAKRTFWEKATILHHEAHRPETSVIPMRYSRHYYDLNRMVKAGVDRDAFAEITLLNEVVKFKKRFYPRSWAQYDKSISGEMTLVPPSRVDEAMQKDYRSMQEMMFGKIPTWSEITVILTNLENQINSRI